MKRFFILSLLIAFGELFSFAGLRAEVPPVPQEKGAKPESTLSKKDRRQLAEIKAKLKKLIKSGSKESQREKLSASARARLSGLAQAKLGFPAHVFKTHGLTTAEVVWSPDGKRLASGGGNPVGSVVVWDVSKGKQVFTLRGGQQFLVKAIAWSPDGKKIASAGLGLEHDSVGVWDSTNGRKVATLVGHEAESESIAWSPDSKRLASSSADKTVRVWDVSTGKVVHTLEGHVGTVKKVTWSPDGTKLASFRDDFRGLDLESGKILYKKHKENVVRLWNAETGESLRVLNGHEGSVTGISWSPDGSKLASSSADETVRVWEVSSGSELYVLKGHQGRGPFFSWSPDGERIAVGGKENNLSISGAARGEKIHTLDGLGGKVTRVAWSPDGKRIAAAEGPDLVVRDTGSWSELQRWKSPPLLVNSSWSPDGTMLAINGGKGASALEVTVRLIPGKDEDSFKKLTPEEAAKALSFEIGEWELTEDWLLVSKQERSRVKVFRYVNRWKEKGKSIEGKGFLIKDGREVEALVTEKEYDPVRGFFIFRHQESGRVETVFHSFYDLATKTFYGVCVSPKPPRPDLRLTRNFRPSGPDEFISNVNYMEDGQVMVVFRSTGIRKK